MTKMCSHCRKELPLTCFGTDKSRVKDGLTHACKVCREISHRNWVLKNRERVSAIQADFYHRNSKKIIAKQVAATKSNPQRRLASALRIRLCRAIEIGQKSGSAVNDLGCSISRLTEYLESKFLSGMTWENWGKASREEKTWHIDHIAPLSKTDLTNREKFLKACHYTNLQPMWAEDNLRKGARV